MKNNNKSEFELALKGIKEAGLYIAQDKDLERLAESAKNSYEGYPLHNWFAKGKYDGATRNEDWKTTSKGTEITVNRDNYDEDFANLYNKSSDNNLDILPFPFLNG